MAVKIGHASKDENGKINGGKSGDQTGKEVCTRNWYSGGWTVLLRPKSETVAEKMAKACEAGCANSKIGYDQYQRNTLRTKAETANWNIGKITDACECDCSSFMCVCAEAAGINMSGTYILGNAPTTSTMRKKFKSTGGFDVLTASKYLNGSGYLKRGDILVKEGSHTVMVLSNGSNVKTNTASTSKKVSVAKYGPVKSLSGAYRTTANLNMRTDAGTDNTILQTIPKGSAVRCYGYYNKDKSGTNWLYVVYRDIAGYCSQKYLKK